MKTLIITIAILGSSLLNNSYGNGTINMNKKLQKVMTFKNGALSVEKNNSEFVKISFKINEQGIVEILEMNYSDELVKIQLVEKLSKMRVEEEHDSQEVYNYNFIFKKL